MNCPFCTSHTRTIKDVHGIKKEWCYGCGKMFTITTEPNGI